MNHLAPAALAILLSGCVPTLPRGGPPSKARLLDAGEIEVTTIDQPIGASNALGRSLPAKIHGAIADAAIELGACMVGVPFRRAGPHADGSSHATFAVAVESASLAAGSGHEPISVLWMEVEARLSLPPDERGRSDYGPTRWRIADPIPRARSEWLASDGALAIERATYLAEEAGVALITEVMGPTRPPRCVLTRGAHGRAAAITDHAEAAVPPGSETPTSPGVAPGLMQYATAGEAARSPSRGRAPPLDTARAATTLGGAAEGARFGTQCLELGPLALPCFVASVTLGVAVAAGASHGEIDAAKRVSERARAMEAVANPWRGSLLDGLNGARIEHRFAAALDRASRGANGAFEAAPTSVRFVESDDHGEVAHLGIEVVARAAGAPAGAERWFCLAGPDLPSRLWVRDEGGILGNVLDALFDRALRLAAAPPSGGVEEGRCPVPVDD